MIVVESGESRSSYSAHPSIPLKLTSATIFAQMAFNYRRSSQSVRSLPLLNKVVAAGGGTYQSEDLAPCSQYSCAVPVNCHLHHNAFLLQQAEIGFNCCKENKRLGGCLYNLAGPMADVSCRSALKKPQMEHQHD
jgi:hypothetical protein